MSVSAISSSTSTYQTDSTTDTSSVVTSTVSATTKNKVYDKMDTNKDGKVSYQEEMTYKQNHPDVTQKTESQQESDSTKSLVGTLVDTMA